ncbi:hypothetical protein [Listeria valentina]|uniref:hypothetical protein n=1 Tax=Listeria valentina TaxID=2705293 RepID=UPI00142FAED5|nr:hypothetical protein [Listeria valentina]
MIFKLYKQEVSVYFFREKWKILCSFILLFLLVFLQASQISEHENLLAKLLSGPSKVDLDNNFYQFPILWFAFYFIQLFHLYNYLGREEQQDKAMFIANGMNRRMIISSRLLTVMSFAGLYWLVFVGLNILFSLSKTGQYSLNQLEELAFFLLALLLLNVLGVMIQLVFNTISALLLTCIFLILSTRFYLFYSIVNATFSSRWMDYPELTRIKMLFMALFILLLLIYLAIFIYRQKDILRK